MEKWFTTKNVKLKARTSIKNVKVKGKLSIKNVKLKWKISIKLEHTEIIKIFKEEIKAINFNMEEYHQMLEKEIMKQH